MKIMHAYSWHKATETELSEINGAKIWQDKEVLKLRLPEMARAEHLSDRTKENSNICYHVWIFKFIER